eukprot:CAMPEP_0201547388 /NCGR_PEP_ID=MMETSP0173_2-20130828/3862_1 /ASSEMBLY_ACC=CAM_ASM_000268 /TAXON_ID=218659 /ORGANISM="Vexillifera sp., Strain DIVA3 564/2" /LENGTH=504 /DNA_ID=CAMNT_0047956417 /DNA_START=32 /DNA_END=1543 /DNA_ORIENTATION=+
MQQHDRFVPFRDSSSTDLQTHFHLHERNSTLSQNTSVYERLLQSELVSCCDAPSSRLSSSRMRRQLNRGNVNRKHAQSLPNLSRRDSKSLSLSSSSGYVNNRSKPKKSTFSAASLPPLPSPVPSDAASTPFPLDQLHGIACTRQISALCSPTRVPPRSRSCISLADQIEQSHALAPLDQRTQSMISTHALKHRPHRQIPRSPTRVLDAPDIRDDFYLNLVDWSAQNVVAVALGSEIWLWNASTSLSTKLTELPRSGGYLQDHITSLRCDPSGTMLAFGTNRGSLQLWDIEKKSRVAYHRKTHSSRIGAIAWSRSGTLSSGSRDRMIINRDRKGGTITSRYMYHKQEVCGLEWSPDGQQLASGGNDNRLYVWDAKKASATRPFRKYCDHMAAVKAIAWSPHQRGLLVSGGGTADRCIRFWHTSSQESLRCVDTGSQVCNLAWSKFDNELVSTHGYSQNQIVIWSYPTMTQMATLTGHTMRVLYLAMSPSGETIATAAGDETLRFW